jgi:hypothetical protein
MKAKASIDAGICGFHTHVESVSNDGQTVEFKINTGCEKIRSLAKEIRNIPAIDAYQEINPAGQSLILSAAIANLKGCCAGCIVPVAVFKTMQVAAGLALPKNISIEISKE